MCEKVKFSLISSTEDTGDPVIKSGIKSSGSYLEAILYTGEDVEGDESFIERGVEEVRVWYVESREKGDMSRMIDEVVRQVECTEVHFLEPETSDLIAPEEDGVRDVVDDYEEKVEMVQHPTQGYLRAEYLVVDWDLDR